MKLHVPPPLSADLSWVHFLVLNLLLRMPLTPTLPIDLGWWGDASTSFSVGIVLGSHWAVWKWAPGFMVGPQMIYDISCAKAIAIELGLCVAISLHFLSPNPVGGHTFLVCSDNIGVVMVTNKGHSHSQEMNKILKHIYLLQAQHQIRLKAVHVASQNNISDTLSCGSITEFLASFPSINAQISIPLLNNLVGKLVPL